jgi:hypothetical protein
MSKKQGVDMAKVLRDIHGEDNGTEDGFFYRGLTTPPPCIFGVCLSCVLICCFAVAVYRVHGGVGQAATGL